MIPGTEEEELRELDPRHPVYNFLVSYYNLRGAKGCRRLARWSPPLLADATVRLSGACEDDLGVGALHVRGARLVDGGVDYDPAAFFRNDDAEARDRAAANYAWYRTILRNTLVHPRPVTHCYGLHEWAMVYDPRPADDDDDGRAPPPSAAYQAHLPRRVSRDVVNAAVERRGVRCTHFDAIRFFAPEAVPLLTTENPTSREDQARLEQPACVHAQMDLLKIALRLSPFLSSDVLGNALEVSLDARRLDVAASPYDATAYGLDPVPVETSEGRAVYKERQIKLMEQGQTVRKDLLNAYDVFLERAFGITQEGTTTTTRTNSHSHDGDNAN